MLKKINIQRQPMEMLNSATRAWEIHGGIDLVVQAGREEANMQVSNIYYVYKYQKD